MQNCPHCGSRLPGVVDAFCPDCHQSLDVAKPDQPLEVSADLGDGLTLRQREYLQFLRDVRPTGPTERSLCRRAFTSWALLLAATGAVAAVAVGLGREYMAYFAAGGFVGCVARDSGGFRRFVQVWPAIAAVTDWARVESLSAGTDRAGTVR